MFSSLAMASIEVSYNLHAPSTDAFEAYERQRWPDGRIPGGKG